MIHKTLNYEKLVDDEYTYYGIPIEKLNGNKNESYVFCYYDNLFKKLNLHKIKDSKLAWKIFDICVSLGIGTSARFVQRILNIKENGKLTKELIDEINKADANYVIDKLINMQIDRYIEIAMANRKELHNLKVNIKRAMDRG